MNQTPTKFIRISEASDRLQVSPQTIRNWIDAGVFAGARKLNPALKNSPYRIPENEIDDFLNSTSEKQIPRAVERAFEHSYKNFDIMKASKK